MLENPATVLPLLFSFRETGLPVTTFTAVSQKVVLWAAGGIPSGWICLYSSASAGVGPVSDWWDSSCGELSTPFQVSRGRAWPLPIGLKEVPSACLWNPRW